MTLIHQWITTPLLVGLSVWIDLGDDSWLVIFFHREGVGLTAAFQMPVVLWPMHNSLPMVMCGLGAMFLFAGLQELYNSDIFDFWLLPPVKTKQKVQTYWLVVYVMMQ